MSSEDKKRSPEKKQSNPNISSKEIKPFPSTKYILFSIATIVILGFTVYGNSLNNKFIWDDEFLVKENTHIRDWSHLPEIFSKNIGSGANIDKKWNFYRPLQILSYAVDFHFWKLNSKGYHLTNILLHILSALFIYWFVNLLFNKNLLSLVTAVFFVIHPIHTEAVTYIAGRADLLASFFMLLSLVLYVKSRSSRSPIPYLLLLTGYILALLSKEGSLIFPVLLLFYHYSFQKKAGRKELFSIIILAFIYIILRLTVLKAALERAPHTTNLLERIPGFFVAVTTYIKLLIFPFDLHMEYGNPLFPWTNFKAILGLILVFGSLIYACQKRGKDKIVFFSIVWFFIALFPMSNLYPINAYMAEHWLYLPSIGFFLLSAEGIDYLYGNKSFRSFAILLSLALVFFYSLLTIRQNTYWNDPIRFYERTLKYAPKSAKVYNNLGRAYTDNNRNEEAEVLFSKAIELDSNFAEAYNNFGLVQASSKRNKDAIIAYKKALEINPDFAEVYNNLGLAYAALNKKKDAINSYKKAIEINADFTEAYNNLGLVYASINRNEDAILSYKKAIEASPNYAMAYNNLGVVYQKINKNGEAIAAYKKAIEINRNFVKAYNNLGVVYSGIKENDKAITAYRKAIEIKPDFVEAYFNLGNVLSAINEEDAIAAYKKAIGINPNYAAAYNNLAVIYYQRKQYKLAVEYFKKAQELGYKNPSFYEALKPYIPST